MNTPGHRTRGRAAALALWCMTAAGAGAADPLVTEVITVHYRTAAELVTIIKPLVPAPGSVSGMLDQIVVRTTEDNLLAIRDVLAQLDMQPRSLVISIRRESRENLLRQGADLQGRVSGNGVQISAGDGRLHDDGVRLRVYDNQQQNRDFGSQQIQVLEGHEAFIQAGRSIPIGQRSVYSGPGGTMVRDGVEYRDVTSGFYVTPAVHGDQVTLHLSQHSARLSRSGGGTIDVQSADTVVAGRLGEWIRVGGAAQHDADTGRGLVYSTRNDRDTDQAIYLKVEERH